MIQPQSPLMAACAEPDRSPIEPADVEKPKAPAAVQSAVQPLSFVALVACMLLFFGLLRGMAHVPADEIIELATWAAGISTLGIYGRNVLILIGRTWINGVGRNSR